MARARLHSIRNTLTAIVASAAIVLTMAVPAGATEPWQKSWGDYDSSDQWHNASWWLQNQHDWVAIHHPEWTESYAGIFGRIGDYDRLHVCHFGDGALDRYLAGPAAEKSADPSAKDDAAPFDIDTSLTKVETP
jgi:hypothetical protein